MLRYSKQWEPVLSQYIEKGLVILKKSKEVNMTTALHHGRVNQDYLICCPVKTNKGFAFILKEIERPLMRKHTVLLRYNPHT